jgi:hypothetical protein
MGANTVRVYTILNSDFYDAVYEYNVTNDDPLYIIHGLWLNDYVQFSRRDAYDKDILKALERDSRKLVDVIWGKCNVNLGSVAGTGIYRKNISPWVIGYILGVEWEDLTVIYTDKKYEDRNNAYDGEYMYTNSDASAFESMLARVGDNIIAYESNGYGQQRLVAFSNWPTTDSFEYNVPITAFFNKVAKIDVEHIKTTDAFISGTFASYHVYPYYPDYLNFESNIESRVDPNGKINTYYSYLKILNDYHSMPVVISEYGVPSSRGMTQQDEHTARNQGGMSETEQADAIIACYHDIMDAGSAGSVVFSWQDEWFKRTWNTMHAVDLKDTAYWSDIQTNEQYFGLLAFDPGKEQSICYMDGCVDEWHNNTPVVEKDGTNLHITYDEKYIYFMVEKNGIDESDVVYLPIDVTPQSGANYCEAYEVGFDQSVDFIIKIHGKNDSDILVQERYEVLRAVYGKEVYGINPYVMPPEKDSTVFKPINMILRMSKMMQENDVADMTVGEFRLLEEKNAEVYPTGILIEGSSNPYLPEYNSLADFCYGQNCLEIKIPWQILNFANPSQMVIHDDYYEHMGIEYIPIKHINIGVAVNPKTNEKINTTAFQVKGWGQNVTYHERLKPAYYALQKLWIMP